jgi:hypothetical protein
MTMTTLAYVKTPEEINELAAEMYRGEVFLRFTHDAAQVDDIKNCWSMILALAEPDVFTEESLKDVGAFYSYMSDAGPWAVNGMPQFFGAKFLHRDNVNALITRLHEIAEFMGVKPSTEEAS